MSIPDVSFGDMPIIKTINRYAVRVFNHYVCHCRHEDCGHVFVTKKYPYKCGRCKRVTWDRPDERTKAAKRKKAK